MGKFRFEVALSKFGFYEVLMNGRALNRRFNSKEECEHEMNAVKSVFNEK